MAIRYACLQCGTTLLNAPHHYSLDEHGHRTEVMACPTCDRYYRRNADGNLVETEAFEIEPP